MADVAAIIDSVTLDEYSSIPLYQQLASSLRDKISSGELDVGAPLPTENALSQALGVGVSTVRSAYALLVKEGLVTRRPRRGSFVSSPELGRQLDGLYSFTSETRRLGKVPGTKVVSFKVIEPGAVVRKKLGLVPGEKVFEARRLRLADGSPIMLETSSIPTRCCPTLTEADVESSLYESITRLSGSAPAEAREVHEAVTLTKEEAKLLGRKAGNPAFLIRRTTRNARGEVFEHCVSICPGDSTCYEMTLRPDGTDVTKKQQRPQGAVS